MKKHLFRIFVLLIPIIFAIISLLGAFIYTFTELGTCPSRAYLGIWCPACGNTRAVISLAMGDIPRSLHYNATPLVLLIIGIIFWIELVARAFNKRLIIFPRSLVFTCCLLGIMLIYYVLRNFIPFLMPL